MLLFLNLSHFTVSSLECLKKGLKTQKKSPAATGKHPSATFSASGDFHGHAGLDRYTPPPQIFFRLHYQKKKKVHKMTLFVVFVYLRAMFSAPSLMSAATNNINLFNSLKKVQDNTQEGVNHFFCCHQSTHFVFI